MINPDVQSTAHERGSLLDRARTLPHTVVRRTAAWRKAKNFSSDVFWQSQPDGVARAVAIALFLAFLPLPIQSVLGVIACVSFRANIPVMLVLVWINNPLTYVPICLLSYKIGELLLGLPPDQTPIVSAELFRGNFTSVNLQSFVDVLLPLLSGAMVAGVVLGVCGYIVTHLIWRLAKPAT